MADGSLRNTDRFLVAAVNALPNAVLVVTPLGVIDYANPAAEALLGVGPALRGTDVDQVPLVLMDESGGLTQLLSESKHAEERVAILRAGARVTWLRCAIRRMEDGRAVVSLMDVSGEHKRIEELSWQTTHDDLTGLLNPAGFMAAVGEHLAATAGTQRRVAAILLSLSSFGMVKDSVSEVRGDSVLHDVGHRISRAVPRGGVAGRVSADRFAVLVALDEQQELDAIVERLARATGDVVDGACTAQIGVAVGGTDVDSAADLMRNVTIALNRAPVGSAGQYTMFEQQFLVELKHRQRMEYELRHAVRALDRQFTVAYQPVVRLDDDQVIGVEGLARWTHPELGCVSPSDFIPLAEKSDLIIEVGSCIRRKAMVEFADLSRTAGMTLAVNVSRTELADRDLVARIVDDVAEAGLSAADVCVEVTERAFGGDYPTIEKTIAALRDHGFMISLDDFGTGVSSLSQLVALPITSVKIAQPFVAALGVREGAQSVLASIVDIAHVSGLVVVAEGVETRDHAEMIAAAGVEFGQGYYYGRPMGIDRIAERVAG